MSPKFLLAAAALSMASMMPVSGAPAGHVGVSSARLSEPSGGFSYVPPPGWKIRTFPGLKYKICYTVLAGGFAPNINILDQAFPSSMSKYAQLNAAQIKQVYTKFKLLSQTAFVTGSGLHGVRLNVMGMPPGSVRYLHQIFYLFPAPGSRKIVATATWLASDGDKYTQAADGAMKTFTLM